MKRFRTPEYKKKAAERMRRWRIENPEEYAASLIKQKDRRELEKLTNPASYERKLERARQERREKYNQDPEYTEKAKRTSREAYAKLRRTILGAYGNVCMCCGESEPTFLEIDHVNGLGGAHYRHVNAGTAYRRIVKAGFPPTFQLLCCNCNRGRARHGGICPHKLKAVSS